MVNIETGSNYAVLQWFLTENVINKPIDSYTLFLTESTNNGLALPTKKQITSIIIQQLYVSQAIQYKLKNLKPYSKYLVEVCAVSNLLGMSDPSNQITFVTKEIGKLKTKFY